MISFKETLTEQKNTHMTHIEDKVLYGGVEGTRQAINALRSLRDMLKQRKLQIRAREIVVKSVKHIGIIIRVYN